MSLPPYFVPAQFQPSLQVIIGLTNSNPVIVTTLDDHLYSNGLIVSFFVPKECGMVQLNNKTGPITVLAADTFSVPIDTTGFDAFIPPALPIESSIQLAQVLPSAEDALTLTSSIHNNNNISPEL